MKVPHEASANTLRQMMVLEHAADVQVFDADMGDSLLHTAWPS